MRFRNLCISTLVLWITLFSSQVTIAQYFGQNKPSYRKFDFRVKKSPHFEIYHYLDNEMLIDQIANQSERWYQRHLEIFGDTFPERNPIILYQNHPEFQQTTAISGTIGIGTQGVTEALKNRIVIPVLETNAQTNHVIGHEMVHAFQFNILTNHDSMSLRMIQNLPLWLVEGMAEYLSIGSIDTHTAMIMRDAMKNNNFPTIRTMTREYKYNPYRFGHAWFSFVAGQWGDTIIRPLYIETAKSGYEVAIKKVLGVDHKELSEMWKVTLQSYYQQFAADSLDKLTGTKLIFDRTAGEINLSPSLSPDGKWLAFFSEKSLFSLDLFLADARTGKIKRKLNSSTRGGDIDGFNFFESVGTWSPDSRYFAYVVVRKGRHQLAIVDINRPRKPAIIPLPGLFAFNNPSWSPDGKYILLSSQKNGQQDLYLFEPASGNLTQLTNDLYSYIHATWSADGSAIVFATDRPQLLQCNENTNFRFNLAYMKLSDPDQITIVPVFPGADNVNPFFSEDGTSIFFLSNNDGFRNLYRYDLETNEAYRLTNYYTGISGITHLSPAISYSPRHQLIAYTHYSRGQYNIYAAPISHFVPVQVDPLRVDLAASVLPPAIRGIFSIVDNNLAVNSKTPVVPADSLTERPYRPQFKLDYIGNTGVGIGVSQYGTGMAGGVFLLFSDILGNNQLFTAVSLNGEIYDFGAQASFLNQKNRIKWGGSVSHIPYRYSLLNYKLDTILIDGQPTLVENMQLFNHRTFEDQVSTFAWFPLSTTRRFEASASFARYYFRLDVINNYFQGYYRIGQRKEKKPTNPGFNLQQVSLAYVQDNSSFGLASPVKGHRMRLQADKYFGRMDMYNLTADYRKYFFLQPFTLAFRLSHYGRYGKDAENSLFYDYFLGYPGLIRGYSSGQISRLSMFETNPEHIEFLLGSRMAIVSTEFRIPFTGPKRLALINTGFLFTELSAFIDGGLAWKSVDKIIIDTSNLIKVGNQRPVFSTGLSLRVNLFGAMVIEPYYAFPFIDKGIKQGVWGLNFMPGW